MTNKRELFILNMINRAKNCMDFIFVTKKEEANLLDCSDS